MKTQNTLLKFSAITAFTFVVMVMAALLATSGFARTEKRENSGFSIEEDYNSGGPLFGSSRTIAIGSYELYFHAWRNGVLEPVSSLPVLSEELILRAYIYDAFGVPAQSGTAIFEYCSYKGRPPNDIERADEAPKEACDAGIASWRRLRSVDVAMPNCPGFGIGNACMNFGIVRIPRDVGFRFSFRGKGRDIDPSVSAPANFTWTVSP